MADSNEAVGGSVDGAARQRRRRRGGGEAALTAARQQRGRTRAPQGRAHRKDSHHDRTATACV